MTTFQFIGRRVRVFTAVRRAIDITMASKIDIVSIFLLIFGYFLRYWFTTFLLSVGAAIFALLVVI